MPRLPTDFSKNVNYMLVCKDINVKELYVGHTTNFTNRKSSHKHNCNNPNRKEYNLKVYTFIRANGGFNNWSMIQLEEFPCKDIFEAAKQERVWCEKIKATLNSNVPCRTYQEYCEDNREHISEYQKDYHQNNRNQLLENKKEYRETHRKQILEYRETHREQRKEQITCICGSTCRKDNIRKHERTNKHIKFLEQPK